MRLQKIISVRENTTKLRGNNKLKRGLPWIDGSLGYRSKFWLFYGKQLIFFLLRLNKTVYG